MSKNSTISRNKTLISGALDTARSGRYSSNIPAALQNNQEGTQSILTLSCGHALAAEKLELKELLELARKNNPELDAMREAASSIEAASRAEGRLDNPTLKIELEELSTERPLEVSPGHAMLTRYTISQMFPLPGKLSLEVKELISDASRITSAMYSTGQASRQDVIKLHADYRRHNLRTPAHNVEHRDRPDVMKKTADPMVGGIFTSGLPELLILPAIYAIWKGRGLKD